METYANKQSLDDDMKIYGGELSRQEIDKIYIAFRQFAEEASHNWPLLSQRQATIGHY
jgi:hypothetical protein